jgi:hypothetical protein
MEESSITIANSHTMFAGPDATELYRAAVIRSALGLLMKGIRPTRGATLTGTLKLVTRYTGRIYKHTEAARAIADLTVWIETMKSAIPVIRKD